jgi:hypothetical protein
MTLPPCRETPWTVTAFTAKGAAQGFAECRVRWKPGYDCRGGCVHENKGDHGQTGDEVRLDMRLEGEFGVSLTVGLAVRDGLLLEPYWHDAYAQRPFDVTYHSGFPTHRDHLLAEPEDCDLLSDGRCWIYTSSTLQAEKLWTPADSESVTELVLLPDVEHRLLDRCGNVWMRMFEELLSSCAIALKESAALPHVCEHCHGSGFVP